MSLLRYDCERCGVLLRTYSGEHLCRDCAELLGRDTHDPFWGDFATPYDESEGLNEFFGDVRVWFSGFGFGAVAGCLFTTLAAYLWSFWL